MHLAGSFDDAQPPKCAALPSGSAAFDLVSGDWSAIVPVIGYTAARAALIGIGMAVAGEREHIVRNAVGGAIAIEGFVLVWAAFKRR
jgi:hypothetical protein